MFSDNRPTCVRDVSINAHVRAAFDEAYSVVFETRESRASGDLRLRDLLLGFAAHYRRLTALPRSVRRSIERHWKRTLASIALLMTLGQAPAWAAVIEVTPGIPPSIHADGKCSLIEAIVNANRDARTHLDCAAGSGADTIVLPEKSQQPLRAREALPSITTRIVIEGRGSTIFRNTSTPSYLNLLNITSAGDLTLNETVVSGAAPSGVSGAFGGINNAGGRLTLHGSSIKGTDGRPGLTNSGTATLENSLISGNGLRRSGYAERTAYAGGVFNASGGTLVLRNTAVTSNGALFNGAGILNAGTLKLIDSAVSENRITYEGIGGGLVNHGTLTLIRSVVADNDADIGGGIENYGVASLLRSTVSGNAAWYSHGWGGGIDNGGTLTLTNSTVSGNSAVYGAGLNQGHRSAGAGPLVLVSSTVTGNTAKGAAEGGGLMVQSGTVTLRRSIISGNTATRGPEISTEPYYLSSPGGAVVADDYNLFGHDGDAGVLGFTPGSTDIVPSKPLGDILLPLSDNGGGSNTHALAIRSPALDASPDDATCPATDQRGNPRPRGPTCDIGAFEGVAVLCNGKVTTMVGTVNDDRLIGTAGPDVISGLLGNDTIYGLEGNDVVCAGSGADLVYGGPGGDLLFGEPGNDRLFGQGGNDTLTGGVGQDRCDGGPGAGDTAIACENISRVP